MAVKLAKSANLGDRIRVSVALIRDWAALPDHASPVVILSEVRLDDDGIKILVMDRPPS